ncbi:D-sedoheptulose 7-phosphate isomerase [Providencia alcalifaciens]|jgi:D-sedoheptulose 7-phosphate isomerase|uniref:D-sedoheptulose 7-phosphate isomerase n=1 Tax=Providencia alcalifaciens TaxID=126385 RepID=UPI000D3386CF|nr:D-sedoheptulose 7-phosphate isomerase [Providencia alcalifaciens]MBG5884479.1 D-sedoheptulose 7-phosphate isomerase [Providencia alcalifaciens]MDR2242526.1 D-sedoheptulose 7-phosphate isomerase [Providencia alcalifaciens]
MYQDLIRGELTEAADTLSKFLSDDANLQAIEKAAVLLADSFKAGGKVLSCGNGGSHCDAMHFAEELTGRYRENRPGYPAIAISDVSHISCVSNDFGYEFVFSRFVEAVGQKGDVLLGISTSGNSGNIIKAIEAARVKGMKVITLTGKDGGKMAGSADIEIRVPHFGYADRIQEIHIKVIHILIQLIEKEMVK